MSCLMKYNCCQHSGLCPNNRICKPVDSLEKSWKRFTCECADGYNGDNCKPIMSCQGYADQGSKISGMYKIVGNDGSVYEVYCHFDSSGIWTLVQSYSVENGSSVTAFVKILSEDHPVSENALTWSGYRLSRERIKSIRDKSSFVQFTCNYEETDNGQCDYVQILLRDIAVDILSLTGFTKYVTIGEGHGKIGQHDLSNGEIHLYQGDRNTLHVHIYQYSTDCHLFRSIRFSCDNLKRVHGCVQNDKSTTQIWFGVRNP